MHYTSNDVRILFKEEKGRRQQLHDDNNNNNNPDRTCMPLIIDTMHAPACHIQPILIFIHSSICKCYLKAPAPILNTALTLKCINADKFIPLL